MRPVPIVVEVAAAGRFTVAERETQARDFTTVGSGTPPATGAETACLITCHRVERYSVVGETIGAIQHTSAQAQWDRPTPTRLDGDDAVRHLMRVAVGLESAVLGEDQVLHQVRVALAELTTESADPRLIRLFELAVGAGRRARAEHPAAHRNLGDLAVRWIENRAGPCRDRSIVVAGSGRIGRLAAAAAARRGALVTVASRSIGNAHRVAERIGGRAATLDDGAALAGLASGVVVALAGPWTSFQPTGPVPVVDLSFPVAVPAAARITLAGALADVDQLYRDAASLQGNGIVSRDFRSHAEVIVDQAVATYREWIASRPSVTALRTLRDRWEAHRRTELQRLMRRLPDLEPRERDLVQAFSERLIAGVLHAPSKALRDDVDGSAASAAKRLFGL